MKTSNLLILLLLILLGLGGCSTYNGLVNKDEAVNQAWANVQSAYQRRADLIPNLVETVKGYAEHEKSTLREVVEARAKATAVTIDPSNLTPEKLRQFQEAQNNLSGALSRLLVTVERYPELKANQNFLELQSQLEGTENRIKVARDKFNETVRIYNQAVRRFPNNLFAGMFGFHRRTMFEAQPGAETAPKVDFSTH